MDNLTPEQYKNNFTMSLYNDIIKRAKEAGLNMSGIISQFQIAVADEQNEGDTGNTFNDLANTYQKLFDAMKPTMLPYDVSVEVGETVFYSRIILDQKGLHMEDRGDNTIAFSTAFVDFFHPMKILYNLIIALAFAAEENKYM
jgi:hypothetical protein